MEQFFLNGVGLCHGNRGYAEFAANHLRPRHISAPLTISDAAELNTLLPGLNLRRLSPHLRQALRAACQALGEAELDFPLSGTVAATTGLFIGSGLGAATASFDFMDSILDCGAQLASPTHFSHSVNNVFCGLLSAALNIQGPCSTVCQFGLSFAGAWQNALDALYAGRVNQALVGAMEEKSLRMRMVAKAAKKYDELVPEENTTVFFLLSKRRQADGVKVSFPRWHRGYIPAKRELWGTLWTSIERSNAATNDGAPNPRLPQPLNTALAYALLRKNNTERINTVCCRHVDYKRLIAADIVLGQKEDNGHGTD